jgi:hypothetical protein
MLTGHCLQDHHDGCPSRFGSCACPCHPHDSDLADRAREHARMNAAQAVAFAWNETDDDLLAPRWARVVA